MTRRAFGDVRRFDPSGAPLGPFAAGLNSPTGLAFDRLGNLYVAVVGEGTVRRYAPSGASLGAFASGLNGPYKLAFDTSGKLYVSENYQGTVKRFDASGTALRDFVTGAANPSAVAFDAQGNLYLARSVSYGVGVVERYAPDGTPLGTFATGLQNPAGLAFDTQGRLYVADNYAGKVERFGPTGTPLGAFAVGLAGPMGLAFPVATQPAEIEIRNLGIESDPFIRQSDSIVAFRVSEAQQGNLDLNGDHDVLDGVLHVYDMSRAETRNLGFAVNPASYAVSGDVVAFPVTPGLGVYVYRSSTGELQNTGSSPTGSPSRAR